jgi:N-dimethylarginine dimethylaminohydrolase
VSGRYRRAVLMGDPARFSVRGGANPHTRTRWGRRRSVNRDLAIRQWERLRDLLRDLGVRILVVPPQRKLPGLVYPANAGFQTELDRELPLSEKCFHLANLLPSREGEQPIYRRVLEASGLRVATLDPRYRLEGEADFFPVGDHYLLTFGEIEKQRFVPTLAFPPWKRIYGFRSDQRVERLLAPIVEPRSILKIELLLESHYHGDTVLCGFGPGRELLLAYSHAITPTGWDLLREVFGDRVIELEEHDAERYAANSFTLTQGGDSLLLMPAGVSEQLLGQVRERGVTPITVDVSEFLKKGGGSVKCMIGDLGPVEDAVSLGGFEFRGVAGA